MYEANIIHIQQAAALFSRSPSPLHWHCSQYTNPDSQYSYLSTAVYNTLELDAESSGGNTLTTEVVNFPNEVKVSKHTFNVWLLLSSALQKNWRTACKRFYFPGVRCPGYKCCPLRTSREINFQARHSHKTRHHSSYCCRGWKGHWQFWERFCVWWMLPVYNIILWILLEFQNFYILNWWQYADKLLR